MTTVINNPGNNTESTDSAIGFVAVIILMIVVIALFFVYVLPMIRNSEAPKNDDIDINVTLPADNPTPTE